MASAVADTSMGVGGDIDKELLPSLHKAAWVSDSNKRLEDDGSIMPTHTRLFFCPSPLPFGGSTV